MTCNSNKLDPRPGCIDMWNAFMVAGASFTIGSDIPLCPCAATEIPQKLISYVEAKHLHKEKNKTEPDYHVDATIHFYIDDQKFDGPRKGIWADPFGALEIIRHFSGIITPDFSTNFDFPDPQKRFNTYRMRAFGRWVGINDIPVINNVRWGTEETWEYCFDGIPYNSMVAIGTVASGLRKTSNRDIFEAGLYKMVEYINPHSIIVYGSANYKCFQNLKKKGINIISFSSDTSLAFSSRKGDDHHE